MMKAGAIATAGMWVFAAAGMGEESPTTPADDGVIGTITQFERALQQRNLAGIAKVVADDLVVFENGGRNDGWKDFRDNHLIPEMKDAAPPMSSKLIKVVTTSAMAWAYTRTEMFADPKDSQKASHLLWSVYVLEKRNGAWKVTMLDWSIAKLKG
jgi:ketosteroid isomerase-like protein